MFQIVFFLLKNVCCSSKIIYSITYQWKDIENNEIISNYRWDKKIIGEDKKKQGNFTL
jgi:hypothetical protein